MANSKISALTDGNPAQSGDEIPIARGGANYKITAGSIASLSGNGDVVGPASATDNAVARFDGTTGKLIQNSAITIEDDGSMVIPANSTNAGLRITQTGSGNALSVEDDTNPDATPFFIDSAGNIGSGVTSTNLAMEMYRTSSATFRFEGDGTGVTIVGRTYSDTAGVSTIYNGQRSRGTKASQAIVQSGDLLAQYRGTGWDGASFIQAGNMEVYVDGTPGTNDMPGRITFSTNPDGAASVVERMRIDNQGRVGIGATPSASTSLRLGKNITGGTSAYGVYQEAQVQSATVTNVAYGFQNVASVSAGGSLSEYRHFDSYQGTLGITPTNQYSFYVNSNLTGATNNYGFFSNIASGTGRYNFYANGTADNYFAGSVGIGAAPSGIESLVVSRNISGAATSYGINNNGVVQSGVTSAYYFVTSGQTAAASYNFGELMHYRAAQGTFGAGSTVTSQFGFIAAGTLIGATNNYGFYSNIAAGTGRWNIYSAGTAANWFAGDVKFDITITAAGTTGAQTINKNGGAVNFAAGATSLVVTDSRVVTNSVIICTVGTDDTTMKSVAAVAGSGSFTLYANAAATAETRVNFLIING